MRINIQVCNNTLSENIGFMGDELLCLKDLDIFNNIPVKTDIELSGGEPDINKSLNRIINMASQKGDVYVDTYGFCMENASFSKKVCEYQVFIKYPDRVINNLWVGKNCYTNLIKMLKNMKNSKIPRVIIFEADKENYTYMKRMIPLSKEIERHLIVRRYVPHKKAYFERFYMDDSMWNLFKSDCSRNGNVIIEEFKERCANMDYFCIGLDGGVYACEHSRKKLCNFKEEIFPRVRSIVINEKEKYYRLNICPRIVEIRREMLVPEKVLLA